MKKLFDQSRGSTSHTTNMLSLARSFGLHDNEVVHVKAGTKLANVKGIYDSKSSTFWLLPELTGSEIFSFNAPVLITDKETVDLGDFNLELGNLHLKHKFSFDTGFTINSCTEVVIVNGSTYRWDGSLPKVVSANSTIDTTGGYKSTAWVNTKYSDSVTSIRELKNKYGTVGEKIYVAENGLTYTAHANLTVFDDIYHAIKGNNIFWLSNASSLSFENFGAKSDNTDSTDFINTCYEIANFYSIPVVQLTGTFTILGKIYIKYESLLSGCTIKPVGDNALIAVNNNSFVEYDASSDIVINMLSTASDGNRGSSYFRGWMDNDEVYNKFFIAETNLPMVTYRGGVVNYVVHNVSFKNGYVQTPIRYPLTAGSVTKLKMMDLSKSGFTVKGLTIDESEYTAKFIVEMFDSNDITLKGFRFINRGEYRQTNVTRINVVNCCRPVIDDCIVSDANATPTGDYTYTFSFVDCYDSLIDNCIADGFGWGTVGNNNCTIFNVRNSQLNRIDFHRPCYVSLTITDCVVGNHGVIGTFLCDTFLTRVNFKQMDQHRFDAKNGFIRTRGDTGGVADGDLYLRDITVTGFIVQSNETGFISIGDHAYADYPKPSGSNVGYYGFSHIYIDNLSFNARGGAIGNMYHKVSDNIAFPLSISMKNIRTVVPNQTAQLFTLNFTKGNSSYPLIVNISDIDSKYIGIRTKQDLDSKVTIDNAWNDCQISINSSGLHQINNSNIRIVGNYENVSGIINNNVRINVNNSVVKRNDEIFSFSPSATGLQVVFTNCTIDSNTTQLNNLAQLKFCSFIDCTYLQSVPRLYSGSTSSLNVQIGNVFPKSITYKVGDNYKTVKMSFGGSYVSGSEVVSLSGTGALTITGGTVSLVYLA